MTVVVTRNRASTRRQRRLRIRVRMASVVGRGLCGEEFLERVGLIPFFGFLTDGGDVFGGDGRGAVAEGVAGVGEDRGEPNVVGPGEAGHFTGVEFAAVVGADEAVEDDAEGNFFVALESLGAGEGRG